MNIYKKLRKEKGLTQTELAEKFGISQTTPSKWEKGLAIPEPQMLKKLSEFYGVSIDCLLDNKDINNFDTRIKELRIQRGLTQISLAKMLGVTQANLSGWENNRWQPDKDSLIKMADIFKVSVDYLLGNNETTTIGERIKGLRIQHGYTQSELAEMLNIEFSNISKWELGKNSPSKELIIKIAKIFNVSIDYLLGNEDCPSTPIETVNPDGEIENEILSLCKNMSVENKAKLLLYAYELTRSSPQ